MVSLSFSSPPKRPHPSQYTNAFGQVFPSTLLTSSPKENTTVFEALEKGLDDLMEACDVVTEKFTEARDSFGEDNMKS